MHSCLCVQGSGVRLPSVACCFSTMSQDPDIAALLQVVDDTVLVTKAMEHLNAILLANNIAGPDADKMRAMLKKRPCSNTTRFPATTTATTPKKATIIALVLRLLQVVSRPPLLVRRLLARRLLLAGRRRMCKILACHENIGNVLLRFSFG